MDPKKFAFTEQRLARIKPPSKGRDTYYDAETPGLIVRVSPSGAKSYTLYRKLSGRPVRMRIGAVGDITLKAAREAAEEAKGTMAKGTNPAEVKRERAAKKATVAMLWAHYLEQWAKPRKRSWRVDEQRYNRHLKGWTDRRLSTITPAEVSALLNRVGQDSGHYESNRLRALLHKMFNMAAGVGFRGANPVHGIERFPEIARERFLQSEEVPRFFEALQTMRATNPATADALEMCVWTGARKGNVVSMRWTELRIVEGDLSEWTIPDSKSKSGKPTTIPLIPQAVEILLRRKADSESEWVFPSVRGGKHASALEKPWHDLIGEAHLEGVRMHDLRRTAGSWMAGSGASLPVIGKALGHTSTAATAIYARLAQGPVREAVRRGADAIAAARDRVDEKPIKLASVVVSHATDAPKPLPTV